MHASQLAAASLFPPKDLWRITETSPASSGDRTMISLRALPSSCGLRMFTKSKTLRLSAEANEIKHLTASSVGAAANKDGSLSAAPSTSHAM